MDQLLFALVSGERRDAFSYVLPPALARGDSLLSAYGNATLAAAKSHPTKSESRIAYAVNRIDRNHIGP